MCAECRFSNHVNAKVGVIRKSLKVDIHLYILYILHHLHYITYIVTAYHAKASPCGAPPDKGVAGMWIHHQHGTKRTAEQLFKFSSSGRTFQRTFGNMSTIIPWMVIFLHESQPRGIPLARWKFFCIGSKSSGSTARRADLGIFWAKEICIGNPPNEKMGHD